jgi:hypothetical protein
MFAAIHALQNAPKGVGRGATLKSLADCKVNLAHKKVGFAKLYDRKTPITAANS